MLYNLTAFDPKQLLKWNHLRGLELKSLFSETVDKLTRLLVCKSQAEMAGNHLSNLNKKRSEKQRVTMPPSICPSIHSLSIFAVCVYGIKYLVL